MNKNLMLEQMINHYSWGNKAKFAADQRKVDEANRHVIDYVLQITDK